MLADGESEDVVGVGEFEGVAADVGGDMVYADEF